MQKNYDAVIIGGGIQGAGCAQALSAQGFSVLLLEQSTIGSGTSSRSSKLIHGGLRYLETGQFSLVRKSLNERALLQKLAPSLVKNRKFYLPVYRKQRLKAWQLRLGLSLYSLLGGLRPNARFRKLPKTEWAQLSGLKQQGLSTVFQYHDAQTDDLLLTRAVIASAKTLGCEVLEQCHFQLAEQNKQSDLDIIFKPTINSTFNSTEPQKISCKVLINAAGPWVEQVQEKILCAAAGPTISLVQGTHIELDKAIAEDIFYVESPDDQRAVFVMPWKGHTLVGTTEKQHHGKPSEHKPSQTEIDYLTKTLLHYFPRYDGQLINSWSGLRVLPQASNSSTHLRPFSARVRDTVIHTDPADSPRVISLYGGKLTAYRVTAEQVSKLAMQRLGKPNKFLDTASLTLS